MKKQKCSCEVKWGLIGGTFFALVHLVWSLLIAVTQTGVQNFVNWLLELHRVSTPITIKPFEPVSALLLLVVTFAFGFVLAWVLAKVAGYVLENC